MTDEPTGDEAKEIYAHFGLAFSCSSVLEHGVANALLVLELLEGRGGAKTRKDWEALVDKHFEDSFAKTLGKLIDRLARHHARSPALAAIVPDLKSCVTERNFLAHHFWREHAVHWFAPKGRASMIHRLEAARDLFTETDKKLSAAIQPISYRHGITADVKRYELELIKREASRAGGR
ncbi:MAG: hypothetical protein ACHQRJ_14465 [Alphaproteobacteria bacterium]